MIWLVLGPSKKNKKKTTLGKIKENIMFWL